MLADGYDIAAIRRELGGLEPSYYGWRDHYGGPRAEHAKRLNEPEKENGTLRRVLAEAELEKAAFGMALQCEVHPD